MSKPFKEEHPLGKLMYHATCSVKFICELYDRDDVNIEGVIPFDYLYSAIQL